MSVILLVDGLPPVYAGMAGGEQVNRVFEKNKCHTLHRRVERKLSLMSQEEVLTRSKDLVERWDGLPSNEKRHIVETIVERVIVGDGEVEFEFLYNPSSASRGQSTPLALAATNCGIDGNLSTNPA
jgi:hypothetical protein